MEGSLGVRKGAWSRVEDDLLRACVERYGEGKWHLVPIRAGLKRCRKSCRLRWLNYLKPSIKRGGFCEDEVDLMIRLHRLLGNRWSLIAGRLPGRTPNDVKNYWNTHHVRKTNKKSLAKRVLLQEDHHTNNNNNAIIIKKGMPSGSNSVRPSHQVIRPQPRTFSKKSTACGGKEEEGGMLLMTESGRTATCYNNNNSLFCEQDWNLNYWDTNGHDDEFEEEQGIIINKQDGLAEDNNHFLIEAHPSWSDDILLDINLWDYINDE